MSKLKDEPSNAVHSFEDNHSCVLQISVHLKRFAKGILAFQKNKNKTRTTYHRLQLANS